MRKLLLVVLSAVSTAAYSQIHTDQNALKTSVSSQLTALNEQARRYEVATIGYNSHHWQNGGVIVVELYQQFFQTGYQKYIIENGHSQGANNGTALIRLAESKGLSHFARVVLGASYDLATSSSGYVNKALPIYVDVRNYSGYKVKMTYLQEKVDVLNNLNQIKINTTPSGTNIADFNVSAIPEFDVTSSGKLQITGSGNHYIENGNVGIGTAAPTEKLSVKGKIRAHEIKVEIANWPDYVFTKDYQLPSLQQTESHIKKEGHLPGIPSAAEVKTSGVELGEMNKKLLQKIEELTLHLIQKEKDIEAQNKRIQRLEEMYLNSNKL